MTALAIPQADGDTVTDMPDLLAIEHAANVAVAETANAEVEQLSARMLPRGLTRVQPVPGETVAEHIRNALQALINEEGRCMAEGGETHPDVFSFMRERMWAALDIVEGRAS